MTQATKLKIAAPFGLLMGIALIVVGNDKNSTFKRLEQDGVDTPAQVVGQSVTSGRRGRKTYRLAVDYRAEAGGATHHKDFSVAKETYERSQNGEPLTVRYLPSDPTVSKLNGESSEGTRMIIAGAVVAFVSVLLGVGGFLQGRP